MVKIKKAFILFLSLCMLCIMALSMVACGDKKEKKYDVTIKLACDECAQEWIFTPDIREMHWERTYDGREHWVHIKAYRLADHPRWGDIWFAPNGEGANVFGCSILYTAEDGKQDTTLRKVRERGDYSYACYADTTSKFWNYRSIRLYIKVI